MNVIGSRPDGWWRDRHGAARKLVEESRDFAHRTGDEITIVFDGRPIPGLDADPVEVRYATQGGPDAADDLIVELVANDVDPSTLEVVTADTRLRQRVRQLSATVSGPRALWRALESRGSGDAC